MKYYVVIIKADSNSIFAFGTVESAKERFHSELAYAYNQHISTTCVIIDSLGNKIISEIAE